jgi:hypothetical protein
MIEAVINPSRMNQRVRSVASPAEAEMVTVEEAIRLRF